MKEGKDNKTSKIRSFFKRFVEKIDKKMEEKAKHGGCCCVNDKKENKSCCSR